MSYNHVAFQMGNITLKLANNTSDLPVFYLILKLGENISMSPEVGSNDKQLAPTKAGFCMFSLLKHHIWAALDQQTVRKQRTILNFMTKFRFAFLYSQLIYLTK